MDNVKHLDVGPSIDEADEWCEYSGKGFFFIPTTVSFKIPISGIMETCLSPDCPYHHKSIEAYERENK